MAHLFTSESVSEGHPDKVADQVSDAILDALLAQDPKSRVACETLVTTGLVMIAGEITTEAYVDMPGIARETIQRIGYDSSDKGFDYRTCAVCTSIDQQSPDIAQGVDAGSGKEQGAGDQGLMFGYACNETPEFMPMSLQLSHQLMKELAYLRKTKAVDFLRPDSKSQVTVEYDGNQVKRIQSVVISTQHAANVSLGEVKAFLMDTLIPRILPSHLLDQNTQFHINPTGRFVVGGPHGDCGLTGRKIIVDTYGGHGAHGGGAFSGKDPSKVDRSAAYACRHIAKNLVASGAVEKCLVQVAYAIGVADPVNISVFDYGTSKVGTEKLEKAVRELWNLKPAAIIESFDLLKPRYRATAAYGHFGRSEPEFTWEQLNRVEALKAFFN